MALDKYIQISTVRGNIDSSNMIRDDFYTLCQKNPNDNIGLRKKSKSHHLPTFKTVDVSIDYLCSDFARFCLALLKKNPFLACEEMSLIPKQPIPISKELEEYIQEFLPDYYGIR